MANSFKNAVVSGVGTSAATIYTTPSATTTTVIGLTIANVTSSPITADIYLTISASNYYLIKNAVIPVGGTLVPVGGDQKVVLATTNSIKVVTNTAASADVILSVLEIA